jgi:hypothetical protein
VTIFELVKLTLDELYEEGKVEYGKKLDDVIIERIGYLAESYKDLGLEERDPVDYSDPATRFAYVYKYVATYGDYLVQTLGLLRNLDGSKYLLEVDMGGG